MKIFHQPEMKTSLEVISTLKNQHFSHPLVTGAIILSRLQDKFIQSHSHQNSDP